MNRSTIGMLVLLFVALGCSFKVGIEYSRHQIRAMAEDLANTDEGTGTNSFSRCLTDMWEQTGELDPEWKGKRRWLLVSGEPGK
jgi:hypothetical protein